MNPLHALSPPPALTWQGRSIGLMLWLFGLSFLPAWAYWRLLTFGLLALLLGSLAWLQAKHWRAAVTLYSLAYLIDNRRPLLIVLQSSHGVWKEITLAYAGLLGHGWGYRPLLTFWHLVLAPFWVELILLLLLLPWLRFALRFARAWRD